MGFIATKYITNVTTKYVTRWRTRYFIEYRVFTKFIDDKGRVVTRVITKIRKPVSPDKFRHTSPKPPVVMVKHIARKSPSPPIKVMSSA